jgi:hypothetical protein
MPEFKFRVLEYRPAHKPGILQGRLALEDERGIQFLDCAYFQKSGSSWISPPAKALPLRDGAPAGAKPDYAQLIGFASPSVRKAWQNAAMAALEAHMALETGQAEEEQDPWLYDDLERQQ